MSSNSTNNCGKLSRCRCQEINLYVDEFSLNGFVVLRKIFPVEIVSQSKQVAINNFNEVLNKINESEFGKF